MSGGRTLLAGFAGPEPLLDAARRAKAAGTIAMDAFTPYPVEGLAEALAIPKPRLPWVMLAGGVAAFLVAYAVEWASATWAYPFNSGGRPPHSWPAFLIAPTEVSILAAAVTGFVTLLVSTGLPRLNHPLFERQAFERASQDQFVLALPHPEDEAVREEVRRLAFDAGAVWVEEAQL